MKKLVLIIIPISNSHAVQAQTTILDEKFDYINPPQNRSQSVNGEGWDFLNFTRNSHYFVIPYQPYMAHLNEGDTNKNFRAEYLITPSINLSCYSHAYLSVDIFFRELTYQDVTEKATIEVSTNGGSSWTTLKTIAGYYNWHTVFADVSAYCGSSNIKFAIKYSDGASWLYGMALTNVKVFSPVAYDAALLPTESHEYVLRNSPYEISGILQNLGSQTINSVNINWMVNNRETNTHTVSSLNLAPLDTISVFHPEIWQAYSLGDYELEFWVSDINGNQDQNISNNTVIKDIDIVSSAVTKKVLLEVIAASWCTLCPDAPKVINEIKSATDNLIPAMIHVQPEWGEPMATDYGVEVTDVYHDDLSFVTTGMIDRHKYPDIQKIDMTRILWKPNVLKQLNSIAPAEITIEKFLDEASRNLTVNISANFFSNLSGDFRFNCYLLEDSVQVKQNNWFTDPDRIPYSNEPHWQYEQGIRYIANYVHNDVFRASFGGLWGIEGSIPGNVSDGSIFNYQFNYKIPDSFNINKLSVVGFVQNYDQNDLNNCEILNAEEIYLGSDQTENVDDNIPASFQLFQNYPNPFNPSTTIQYILPISGQVTLKIYNTLGQEIMTLINGWRSAGENKVHWLAKGIPSGVYFYRLQAGNYSKTRKLILIR